MSVPPPSVSSLVLGWVLDPGPVLLVVVAGVLYAGGVRRLARRGRAWPVPRSVGFMSGLGLVVVATCSGLARYDTVLFGLHVVQHMLLGMVAPLLLALGAPITLALQASSRPTQRGVLRILHSTPVVALTHPVVAWVLFGGTLFGLYFSPLFELSLRNDLVHGAVHLHFLAVGSLFCWTALGIDPVRRRMPHGARVLFVLLAVPFHAVLGLALLSSTQPLAGGFYETVRPEWAGTVLGDQRAGGGALWAFGDLFGLLATGIVLAQWMSHEEQVARRHDRQLERAVAAPGKESQERSQRED